MSAYSAKGRAERTQRVTTPSLRETRDHVERPFFIMRTIKTPSLRFVTMEDKSAVGGNRIARETEPVDLSRWSIVEVSTWRVAVMTIVWSLAGVTVAPFSVTPGKSPTMVKPSWSSEMSTSKGKEREEVVVIISSKNVSNNGASIVSIIIMCGV